MPGFELYALWIAIALYALASAFVVVSVALSSLRGTRTAVLLASLGAVSHAIALGARWVRLGHGPAIGFFEVASGLALLGVLAFVIAGLRWPGLRVAGAGIMPVCLLILGATLLADPQARAATGSLASGWLVVHVSFANLAFGCYAAAAVLAGGQLMREAGPGRWRSWTRLLPPAEELDSLTFRLVGAGLLLQGVMIVSGAVWANDAWGRYWGWDPMETWSLVAWVVYAVYLHLTLTMGWRGRRASWLVIGALAVILFSLLGVPIVYRSVHGAYLQF